MTVGQSVYIFVNRSGLTPKSSNDKLVCGCYTVREWAIGKYD